MLLENVVRYGGIGRRIPALAVTFAIQNARRPVQKVGLHIGFGRIPERLRQRIEGKSAEVGLIGEQIVGVIASPRPLLAGVVAVDRRRPYERRSRGQSPELVGGQRLGRRQIEDARHPVALQATSSPAVRKSRQRRHLKRQRLARSGAGRDHGVPPGMYVAQRLALVTPELGDALTRIHRAHLGIHPRRPRFDDGMAGGDVLDVGHPFAVAKDDVGRIHEVKCPRPCSPVQASGDPCHARSHRKSDAVPKHCRWANPCAC